MRPLDALAVAIAIATLLAGSRWLAADRDAPRGSVAPAACVSPTAGWRDDRGGLRDWSQPVRLASNGAVLACLPTAGTLRFTMSGAEALGRGAHAVVVLDDVTAWDGLVVAPRDVELVVEAGASVLVAFTNDLYRSAEEDRGLWLSAVALTPR